MRLVREKKHCLFLILSFVFVNFCILLQLIVLSVNIIQLPKIRRTHLPKLEKCLRQICGDQDFTVTNSTHVFSFLNV